MKVLFIGGTGVISSACSELAVQQGIDLYLLNRGQTVDRRFACTIPFGWGAREIVSWHEADSSRQTVDKHVDALMDRVIAAYRSIWP